MTETLFRLDGARRRDPAIAAWFAVQDELRQMVQPWFKQIRDCGPDVREILHDRCPTACVEDAPFAYVAAFRAHASIGFFQGAALADPAGLLQGSGNHMRHVKLRWGEKADDRAIARLIAAAYHDMHARLD
jgi:hypothetical protein